MPMPQFVLVNVALVAQVAAVGDFAVEFEVVSDQEVGVAFQKASHNAGAAEQISAMQAAFAQALLDDVDGAAQKRQQRSLVAKVGDDLLAQISRVFKIVRMGRQIRLRG